jgi:hypothetical protein
MVHEQHKTVCSRRSRDATRNPQKKRVSIFDERSHYVIENKGSGKRTKPNEANVDGLVELSGFGDSGCPWLFICAGWRRASALRAASFYSRNLIETSLDPLVTISAEGKITDSTPPPRRLPA